MSVKQFITTSWLKTQAGQREREPDPYSQAVQSQLYEPCPDEEHPTPSCPRDP